MALIENSNSTMRKNLQILRFAYPTLATLLLAVCLLSATEPVKSTPGSFDSTPGSCHTNQSGGDKNQGEPTIGNGKLSITFINTANGKPVVLRDSAYSNYFGEQYTISKLKYYISNLVFSSNGKDQEAGTYFLVNAANESNAFDITLPAGNYSSIQFLLGVDSIRNCSGAQTGALDPMNDMFWTWNSGYVMFKLEGSSTASTADLQRLEYHIGGYKGANNVATKINLPFGAGQGLTIKPGSTTELVIEMNLDHFWHGDTDNKIADLPMCMITGAPALKLAANFKHLFSIKNIR